MDNELLRALLDSVKLSILRAKRRDAGGLNPEEQERARELELRSRGLGSSWTLS